MTFKVQVGPAQITIHQGQTVLVTEPDGQIEWPSQRGLYFYDTRMISAWAVYANGEPWDLLNGGAVAYHAARIFQTNRAFMSEDGPISARTLGLVIDRHIDGGLHEDIEITNNGQKAVRFNFEIAIRADFADIFEVKSESIVRRGRITTSWSAKRQVLRISYVNKDFCREVIVRTANGDGAPTVNANGRLSFDIALKAGQGWHRCLIYDLVDGPKRLRAPRGCAHSSSPAWRLPRTKRTSEIQTMGARLHGPPGAAGVPSPAGKAQRPRLWACCSRAVPDLLFGAAPPLRLQGQALR
jgi:N-terminal domain of (some) glycogen debranching enzymes